MFEPAFLAHNIKKYRKKNGLSQNELANLLFVSAQAVSKWECAAAMPDVENLYSLAENLNISVDILLGRLENNKKIMIGIDGGGSKTEFIMFDESGVILNKIILGPCNPNAVGIEKSALLLQRGIDELFKINSNVCGIFIGASGFMSGNNAEEIKKILKKVYPYTKIKCKTDIVNVIASCTDTKECIAVICGTGSVVYAYENGILTRLTGWGYLLSKQGSGFDIGRDALYASLQDEEGLGEKTLITELVKLKLGKSVIDSIHEIYKNDQSFIASFAPLVFEAFKKGDYIAKKIIFENAERLAFVINHAAENYNCGNKVILSGGLILENHIFIKILKEKLSSDLNIIIPQYPQVYGACMLCARMCQADTELFTSKFMKQYKEGAKI